MEAFHGSMTAFVLGPVSLYLAPQEVLNTQLSTGTTPHWYLQIQYKELACARGLPRDVVSTIETDTRTVSTTFKGHALFKQAPLVSSWVKRAAHPKPTSLWCLM
jgi:hypothetical protein